MSLPPASAGGVSPRNGRRRPAARLALMAACAVLAAGFCALGAWQIKRLAWKLDLIARVEARVHAAPVAAPAPGAFGADDEYRRVRVSGHFLNDRETLTQAVTERGGGFWVLTPLVSDAGFTVLVNRGFVPPEARDPARRTAGLIDGPVTVTGLMRRSEPGGGFLRSNDAAAGRWFSRDVAAIAAAQRLGPAAPYFIDADATPVPGGAPAGGLTVLTFTNNHLVYALTWFALAGMSAAALAFLWRHPDAAESDPSPADAARPGAGAS